jgi:hypothetical protein
MTGRGRLRSPGGYISTFFFFFAVLLGFWALSPELLFAPPDLLFALLLFPFTLYFVLFICLSFNFIYALCSYHVLC